VRVPGGGIKIAGCTSARIRPDLQSNSLAAASSPNRITTCRQQAHSVHHHHPPKHHLIVALSLRPVPSPANEPSATPAQSPPAAVGKRMRLRLLLLARRPRRDQSRPLLCRRARLQAQCQPHVTRRRAPRDYRARASESRSSRHREPFCRPRCL
jgi:hypothetical protein